MIQLSLVVACSRPRLAQILLESIEKQKGLSEIEVFVSGDTESLSLAGSWGFSCEYFPTKETHPNIRRNKGISSAQGAHIAFIDDDAYLGEGWLAEALGLINKWPQRIFTGPERPTRNSSMAQTIYKAQKLWLCEFSSAHINFKDEEAHWSDVPFCNAIVPKSIFKNKMLSESIPWDMDDFHLFSNIDTQITIFNSSKLLIFHDRYNDSLMQHLLYKWRLRQRTGEKLISHFSLYAKVPGVILTLIAPILGVFIYSLSPALFTALVIIYFLSILLYSFFIYRRGIAFFIAIIIALVHGVTVTAFLVGVFIGLLGLLKR